MQEVVFLCSHFSEQIKQIQKTIGFKKWLDINKKIDESYDFCNLKEWITKCYICEKNNIPIYFGENIDVFYFFKPFVITVKNKKYKNKYPFAICDAITDLRYKLYEK